MKRVQWVLVGLLIVAMLVPIWQGVYPPIYDYPNHLLEAQIVTHYHDDNFDYKSYYKIRHNWYIEPNSLSTILFVALGQLMPITIAGRVVLSLYALVFIAGMTSLTLMRGNSWLFLFTPVLASNYTFTSGWINFSYGAALSLFAFALYLQWQEYNRRSHLVMLAVCLLSIYLAHLVAWVLIVISISAMIAADKWNIRRHGVLFVVLNSAVPLLAVTRPTIVLLTLLIAPCMWFSARVVRRILPNQRGVIIIFIFIVLVELLALKFIRSTINSLDIEIGYSIFDKKIYPIRLFPLPHQAHRVDPILRGYNYNLLLLLFTITAALFSNTRLYTVGSGKRGLIGIGVLSVVYLAIPSHTADLWDTEPRVLLYMSFILLIIARWPRKNSLRWWIASSATVTLFLSHVTISIYYAAAYQQQVHVWTAELEKLVPARSILMLRGNETSAFSHLATRDIVNTYYSGEHFATVYTISHGGFISHIFDSGPVQPRSDIPIPLYYWNDFDAGRFVQDNCNKLQRSYDAVIVWGVPQANMIKQLNACFVPGPHTADLSIWNRSERRSEVQP